MRRSGGFGLRLGGSLDSHRERDGFLLTQGVRRFGVDLLVQLIIDDAGRVGGERQIVWRSALE
jgi:hypothetical protein